MWSHDARPPPEAVRHTSWSGCMGVWTAGEGHRLGGLYAVTTLWRPHWGLGTVFAGKRNPNWDGEFALERGRQTRVLIGCIPTLRSHWKDKCGWHVTKGPLSPAGGNISQWAAGERGPYLLKTLRWWVLFLTPYSSYLFLCIVFSMYMYLLFLASLAL